MWINTNNCISFVETFKEENMIRKYNFTKKLITDFNENDTVYMTKIIGKYSYTFLLKFKTFSRGIITGEILEIQPNNMKGIHIGKKYFTKGSELSGKISKCYTSGENSVAMWFTKKDKKWCCS